MARTASFCEAVETASGDLNAENVQLVRVESRRIHEALEGLRPWIHDGRFSRFRRLTRKARRILSPLREMDRTHEVITELAEKNPKHPVELLLTPLETQREELAAKIAEKMQALPLNRFRKDLAATLDNVDNAPPSGRAFVSHAANLLARRRDRFVEDLDLVGADANPDTVGRLLINHKKLTHVVEIFSTLPFETVESLSALEVIGTGFDNWRNMTLFERYLSIMLDDPDFLKGKRKAPAQLAKLLEDTGGERETRFDEAMDLVDMTGVRSYLRQLMREIMSDSMVVRPRQW